MKSSIQHPYLYAYLRSKVLNLLSMIIMSSLLLAGAVRSLVWPLTIAAVAFIAFAGYSIWFWTKKPASIIVNYWLSNMSSLFALYFLIVAAWMPANPWWYVFPTLCSIAALIIAFVRPRDITFAFRLK